MKKLLLGIAALAILAVGLRGYYFRQNRKRI